MVSKYAKYPERCVGPGIAPTLVEVAMAFGGTVPLQWLEWHISYLAEYSGCKQKLTKLQLQQLAEDINQDYWYLKLTELMWFFSLARRGRLGELGWNTFDPVRINQMLNCFVKDYRNPLIKKLMDEKMEEKIKNAAKNAIPMPTHIQEKMDRLLKKMEKMLLFIFFSYGIF